MYSDAKQLNNAKKSFFFKKPAMFAKFMEKEFWQESGGKRKKCTSYLLEIEKIINDGKIEHEKKIEKVNRIFQKIINEIFPQLNYLQKNKIFAAIYCRLGIEIKSQLTDAEKKLIIEQKALHAFSEYEKHYCGTIFNGIKKKIQPILPIKIFISYAWPYSAYDYEKWTQDFLIILHNDLKRMGFEAKLDVLDSTYGKSGTKFMEEGTDENEFVLLIVTDSYVAKCSHNNFNVSFEFRKIKERIVRELKDSKDKESSIIPLLISGQVDKAFANQLGDDKYKLNIVEWINNSTPVNRANYYLGLKNLVQSICRKKGIELSDEDFGSNDPDSKIIQGFSKKMIDSYYGSNEFKKIKNYNERNISIAPVSSSENKLVLNTQTISKNIYSNIKFESYKYVENWCYRKLLTKFSYKKLGKDPEISNKFAITGMAGSGKTFLAQKYAHEYKNHLQKTSLPNCKAIVYELNAENEDTLRADYIEMLKDIGITIKSRELPDVLRRVNQELKNWRNSLLIFDNATKNIAKFFPQCIGTYHLATSQDLTFYPEANNESFCLNPDLEENAASVIKDGNKILYKFSQRVNESEKNAEKIVRELGGLPLSLHLMAAYIFQEKKSFLEVYEDMKSTPKLFFDNEEEENIGNNSSYNRSTFMTIALVIDKILKKGGEDFLLISCLLPSNAITEKVISNYLKHKYKNKELNLKTTFSIGKNLLMSHSFLAAKASGCYIMHRSIQKVIRAIYFEAYNQKSVKNERFFFNEKDKTKFQKSFLNSLNCLIQALNELKPKESEIHEVQNTWAIQAAAAIAHLVKFFEKQNKSMTSINISAELKEAKLSLNVLQNNLACLYLYFHMPRRSNVIWKNLIIAHFPWIKEFLINNLLFPKAEPCEKKQQLKNLDKLVEDFTKSKNYKNLKEKIIIKKEIAFWLYGLGRSYCNLLYYEVSLNILKLSLAIYTGLLSDKNNCDDLINIANHHEFIGVNYHNLNNFKMALRHYVFSLMFRQIICEKTNVKKDLVNKLSNLFLSEKDDNEFKNIGINYCNNTLYYDASVADSYNNIGMIYSVLGDHQKALLHHRKALEIRENLFKNTENSPDIARSEHNIGKCLLDLEKPKLALIHLQKSLHMRKICITEHHPSYITNLNNIGVCYKALGNIEDALKTHQEALKLNNEIEDKPYEHRCLYYLAECYRLLKNYDKAQEKQKESYNIRKKIFGERHIEVADSLYSLGMIYEAISNMKEAEKCFSQALDIFKNTLGSSHITTKKANQHYSVFLVNFEKRKQKENLVESKPKKDAFFSGSNKKIVPYNNTNPLNNAYSGENPPTIPFQIDKKIL